MVRSGYGSHAKLALTKVEVAVLERRTERVTQSRALSIHGRTLEVFAPRGLADRFLARRRSIPSGHFGALDTRLDYETFNRVDRRAKRDYSPVECIGSRDPRWHNEQEIE